MEHTKKPPTEAVNMTFTGPVAMMQKALEAMQALGFKKVEEPPLVSGVEDSIPWRESAHFKDMPFPGSYLAGLRHREDMTQSELAERTGIPRRHISEMENGKRPIGKQNARKLAEALGADPRILLSV